MTRQALSRLEHEIIIFNIFKTSIEFRNLSLTRIYLASWVDLKKIIINKEVGEMARLNQVQNFGSIVYTRQKIIGDSPR